MFLDWPTKPARLRAFDVTGILSIIGDGAMLLLALAFDGACCRGPSRIFIDHNHSLSILDDVVC